MKSPSASHLSDTAVRAAQAGGKQLLKFFHTKIQVREKKDAGLVTNADLASERAILKVLMDAFPDFGVLAEESGRRESRSLGRWVIDPLDGTTNFVHRFPMFCVSIGAEWAGKLVAGVIFHPVLDETYVAIRGKGAYVNGQRLRASKTKKLENSLLTTGFSYHKDHVLHREMESFERLSAVARAIRRPGSAALDLAYTARGVFDGFWERRLSPWDVAAGALMVEEAGGRVTDFQGNPFLVDSPTVLASNGYLHQPLLQAIAPEYRPI